MRKHTILGLFGLVSVFMPGLDLRAAFIFDAHPGLYTSYEYSDNYKGTVQNAQSENVYFIGPSLGLTCASPSTNLDLTGRYTKSFHQRFHEDDSPDINLSANALYTAPLQTARCSYGFTRTLTRESLNEPFGEVRRNTGSVSYTATLTRSLSMNAGGNILSEKWNSAAVNAQNLLNPGANFGITYQPDPMDTLSMSAQRGYYFYETNPDVTETQCSMGIMHALSPDLSAGLNSSYNHDEKTRDADDDRYDVNLTGQYTMNQTTTLNISGGYSWLIMEKVDRQGSYIVSVSLDKNLKYDRFHLSISKGYISEFTSSNYGTYNTKSASATWTRQWLQALSSSTSIAVSEQNPSLGTPGEDETDVNANIALSWRPVEQFTGSMRYEHLQTRYKSLGTERENRYTVTAEVRY